MHKNLKKILTIGAVAVFSTAVIFASNNLKDTKSCKTVVKVDVDKIINNFVKKINTKPLSKQEIDKYIGVFYIYLAGEIEDLAAKNNYTVLPKKAVITGADDITETVNANVNANVMKELKGIN